MGNGCNKMDGGMVEGLIDGIERIEKMSVQHVHKVDELIKPLDWARLGLKIHKVDH